MRHAMPPAASTLKFKSSLRHALLFCIVAIVAYYSGRLVVESVSRWSVVATAVPVTAPIDVGTQCHLSVSSATIANRSYGSVVVVAPVRTKQDVLALDRSYMSWAHLPSWSGDIIDRVDIVFVVRPDDVSIIAAMVPKTESWSKSRQEKGAAAQGSTTLLQVDVRNGKPLDWTSVIAAWRESDASCDDVERIRNRNGPSTYVFLRSPSTMVSLTRMPSFLHKLAASIGNSALVVTSPEAQSRVMESATGTGLLSKVFKESFWSTSSQATSVAWDRDTPTFIATSEAFAALRCEQFAKQNECTRRTNGDGEKWQHWIPACVETISAVTVVTSKAIAVVSSSVKATTAHAIETKTPLITVEGVPQQEWVYYEYFLNRMQRLKLH